MKPGFGMCDCPSCRCYRLRRATRPQLLTRWDWVFVALCLMGAMMCMWEMVRG